MKIGEMVKVSVQNRSAVLSTNMYPNEPKTYVYEGEIVKGPSWLGNDFVCIKTGKLDALDREDVKFVNLKNVISVNDSDFSFENEPAKSEDKIVMVTGSKGDQYTVTLKDDGTASCTCAGYGWRGKCKHIEQAKEK